MDMDYFYETEEIGNMTYSFGTEEVKQKRMWNDFHIWIDEKENIAYFHGTNCVYISFLPYYISFPSWIIIHNIWMYLNICITVLSISFYDFNICSI